jgi:hypothetical protein
MFTKRGVVIEPCQLCAGCLRANDEIGTTNTHCRAIHITTRYLLLPGQSSLSLGYLFASVVLLIKAHSSPKLKAGIDRLFLCTNSFRVVSRQLSGCNYNGPMRPNRGHSASAEAEAEAEASNSAKAEASTSAKAVASTSTCRKIQQTSSGRIGQHVTFCGHVEGANTRKQKLVCFSSKA